MKFTQADHQAARREGWDIFDCNDGFQLQKLDDPQAFDENLGFNGPVFDSDADAWVWVVCGVGSNRLHERALEYLYHHSVDEHARVMDHVIG